MARLPGAYECDNPDCTNMFRKEERTRIKVTMKTGGDPEKGYAKDVCPTCAEAFDPTDLALKPVETRGEEVPPSITVAGAAAAAVGTGTH